MRNFNVNVIDRKVEEFVESNMDALKSCDDISDSEVFNTYSATVIDELATAIFDYSNDDKKLFSGVLKDEIDKLLDAIRNEKNALSESGVDADEIEVCEAQMVYSYTDGYLEDLLCEKVAKMCKH